MTAEYDLYNLTEGRGQQTNFTTQLIKLIFKADSINRAKLAIGFPKEVQLVESYEKTGEIPGFPMSGSVPVADKGGS